MVGEQAVTRDDIGAFCAWLGDRGGSIAGDDDDVARAYARHVDVPFLVARAVLRAAEEQGYVEAPAGRPAPVEGLPTLVSSAHLYEEGTCRRCKVSWPCLSVVSGVDDAPEPALNVDPTSRPSDPANARVDLSIAGLAVDSGLRDRLPDGSLAIRWRLSADVRAEIEARGTKSLLGRQITFLPGVDR